MNTYGFSSLRCDEPMLDKRLRWACVMDGEGELDVLDEGIR